MRRRKYGNVKVQLDGYRFDSKAEAQRYGELKLLVQAEEIRELRVHPVFVLQAAFQDAAGKRRRAITYEADFMYWEHGEYGVAGHHPRLGRWIVEDVKGKRTAVFNIKLKLFLYRYRIYHFRLIPA